MKSPKPKSFERTEIDLTKISIPKITTAGRYRARESAVKWAKRMGNLAFFSLMVFILYLAVEEKGKADQQACASKVALGWEKLRAEQNAARWQKWQDEGSRGHYPSAKQYMTFNDRALLERELCPKGIKSR
ncbi:hypothetical protein [Shewanella waksmanii]|uniref:hypothetical protein n=1 Tax=Shewanella waksmanii TaxID=213783 RepID=UPI000490EC08|nr:hypothetical protein [Shewanella waksmanii]